MNARLRWHYTTMVIFSPNVTEELITFTVSGRGTERSKNYICEALPTEMEEFIENFDANKDVVPFTSTFLVEEV